MVRSKSKYFVLLSFLGIISTSTITATSNTCERTTLRGLDGVQVIVEVLKQGRVEINLDEKVIIGEIKTVLAATALEFHDSAKASEDGNILVTTISIMRPPKEMKEIADWYIFTVELAMRQRMFLVRRHWVKTSAISWIATLTGVSPAADLQTNIRRDVLLNIKKFVKDYQEINE